MVETFSNIRKSRSLLNKFGIYITVGNLYPIQQQIMEGMKTSLLLRFVYLAMFMEFCTHAVNFLESRKILT